jgi:nucleoside-diphosphate-sugar epimerase
LLHDQPITVYRGYKRTSTFITDMARTLANIVDHLKPGEVYNIGGEDFHSIEDAAEMALKLLHKEAKRKELISYKDEEILTTKVKKADCAKARRDLDHKSTVSLEDGIRQTLAWMKETYRVR